MSPQCQAHVWQIVDAQYMFFCVKMGETVTPGGWPLLSLGIALPSAPGSAEFALGTPGRVRFSKIRVWMREAWAGGRGEGTGYIVY